MLYSTTPPYPSVDTLDDFLDIMSELFNRITDRWDELLFKQPFRERIRTAWNTLKVRISNIKTRLAHLSTETLDNAGLSPSLLKLKLDAFNDAWHKFLENGTIPLLLKVLSWIDIILGSIASVVPAAEAIKELKEAIVKFIEENNSSVISVTV